MSMLIKGSQSLCKKPIFVLAFLIYPCLSFSQVYNINNEEDTIRIILDDEYIVISNFKSNFSLIVFNTDIADSDNSGPIPSPVINEILYIISHQ